MNITRSILRIGILAVSAAAALAAPDPQTEKTRGPAPGSPKIFITSLDGFESYISAAILKKHVPVFLVASQENATLVMTSSVQAKQDSTASKFVRCALLYCIGIEGTQTATVTLINPATQAVVWAYNVKKGSAGAYQSTAEAIAKHLKEFLEKTPPDYAASQGLSASKR